LHHIIIEEFRFCACDKYLGVLSDLDIVEREVPVTEDKPVKSKKGVYRIKDEFF
jgi:AAA+ ATPase superfamily predicted ATPase